MNSPLILNVVGNANVTCEQTFIKSLLTSAPVSVNNGLVGGTIDYLVLGNSYRLYFMNSAKQWSGTTGNQSVGPYSQNANRH